MNGTVTMTTKDIVGNDTKERDDDIGDKDDDHQVVDDHQVADNNQQSCMDRCEMRCDRCCSPCLLKYHQPPKDGDTCCYRLRYSLLCPPHGIIAVGILYILLVFIVWGVLWAITGDNALPGGNLFALFVLWVAAVVGGKLISLIKLPPLLGMLIVGVLLRNVPYINVAADIEADWSMTLRNIAFTVILIRAGLGLDAQALRKLKIVCLRLAFTPCTVECITAAIVAYLLLGFPWDWGFMLGFVLGAVSPAVVVPSMLNLQEKGYGMDKGIPTLVIAAASVDDVLAITGFSVALGITFSTGSIVFTIFRGPIEVLVGICLGIVLGIIMWYIPHGKQTSLIGYRSLFLFASGLFGLFGTGALELAGSGALAVLTMAFVAAHRWGDDKEPIGNVMAIFWNFFQPFLFALIGAEILIENLDPNTIGLGIAVLAIGLTVRVIVSFFVVLKCGFTIKERLFIALAWLPKATVQAAIGSIAYDTAREREAGDEAIQLGSQILTIAVLSIIITAPLGAAAIALSGPRLLHKSQDAKYKKIDAKQETRTNKDNDAEAGVAMITTETGV
ncbi:sodium/hydrogen exchanger 9B2-like isoform X2 [Glandiceps talaboti]